MRKNKSLMLFGIFVVFFASFFISFVSGSIVINEEPEELYNMGDNVDVSFKLIPEKNLNSDISFSIYITCNGIETNPEKSEVGGMKAKEVEEFSSKIFLSERRLGRTTGTCSIKGVLEDSISGEVYDSKTTENFEVSDIINVKVLSEERVFNPGEVMLIEGEAIKENGIAPDSSFVESKLIKGDNEIKTSTNTVKKGYFSFETQLPEELEAGKYDIKIQVYETYKEKKTNKGAEEYSIKINQVPTNLEILVDKSEKEIEPGTNLKAKAILHDQTGEPIESSVNFTLKKEKEILEKETIPTGKDFTYFVVSNEPVSNWTLIAESEGFETKTIFNIIEKEKVNLEIINRTLLAINEGNVPYKKILDVKIGNQTLEFNVSLGLGEEKKYLLSAPQGNYSLEIFNDKGESMINNQVTLTGKAIKIEEAKENIFSLMNYPLIWIFIVLILGFVAFSIFKGSGKRSFFGYVVPKKGKPKVVKKDKKEKHPKNVLLSSAPVADLSLSIHGDKQKSSVVCLNIKNFEKVNSNKDKIKETLQELGDLAKKSKASVYENQDKIFFIFSPLKTKTFKNDKPSVHLAESMKKILVEHNRLFKQNIDFGISINSGEIISKLEKGVLKFMGLGGFITDAKRISSLSKNEIYLTESAKQRLEYEAKTEKHTEQGVDFYTIKEMRDREQNRKFISEFMKRVKEEK